MTKLKQNSDSQPPDEKQVEKSSRIEDALNKIMRSVEQHRDLSILRKAIEIDLVILFSETDGMGYAAGLRMGGILKGLDDEAKAIHDAEVALGIEPPEPEHFDDTDYAEDDERRDKIWMDYEATSQLNPDEK